MKNHRRVKDNIYFCIDLESKKPEVLEYSGEVLEGDLKYFRVKSPLSISDYDWKVFRSEKEADKWLLQFNHALKRLKRLADGKWKPGPSLIYRRHYLAQTLMGEKLQTFRNYKKDWKAGTVLKLHDQTFYIMVHLKRVTKTSKGYKYSFSLLK